MHVSLKKPFRYVPFAHNLPCAQGMPQAREQRGLVDAFATSAARRAGAVGPPVRVTAVGNSVGATFFF